MVGLGFWFLLIIVIGVLAADASPYIEETWNDFQEWRMEKVRDKEYHGKHEKRS